MLAAEAALRLSYTHCSTKLVQVEALCTCFPTKSDPSTVAHTWEGFKLDVCRGRAFLSKFHPHPPRRTLRLVSSASPSFVRAPQRPQANSFSLTHTNSMAASHLFRTPYEFHKRDPVTLVELRMRKLSNIIRQKPRWWEKLNDNALVARWRATFVKLDQRNRQNMVALWPGDITDAQLDYVFDELKWVASQLESTTGIHVSQSVTVVVTIH